MSKPIKQSESNTPTSKVIMLHRGFPSDSSLSETRRKYIATSRNLEYTEDNVVNNLAAGFNEISSGSEGGIEMENHLDRVLDRMDKDMREREDRYHNDSREREDRYRKDAIEREDRYRQEQQLLRSEQVERDRQLREELRVRDNQLRDLVLEIKTDLKSEISELKEKSEAANKHTLAIAITTIIGIAAMVVAVFVSLFNK